MQSQQKRKCWLFSAKPVVGIIVILPENEIGRDKKTARIRLRDAGREINSGAGQSQQASVARVQVTL